MELEPITRQEQIIAGKDLEPITRMEKFLKEYGGGGGASHWNELEGKPFVTVVGGDTLEWDGNTDGVPYLEEMELYRIADSAPTLNDLNNAGDNISAVIGLASSGEEYTVPRNKIFFEDMGLSGAVQMSIAGGAILLLFPEDADAGEGLVIQKGVYTTVFSTEEGGIYVKSLTVSGYTGFTKEQIDPAVLPTRKFYCDATDMVYLYTDKAFTTKATREEVMEAILNNAIVIAMVHLGAVFATAHIAMANYSGTYATIWAISSISDAGVATYTKLYTAEYTAS